MDGGVCGMWQGLFCISRRRKCSLGATGFSFGGWQGSMKGRKGGRNTENTSERKQDAATDGHGGISTL
ncbi:MAG: hypothetical protein HDR54_06615 [Treponema sp.]|nr:hypothetical protein [Treponema sp.]